MSLPDQIADFTAFALLLADQQGDEVTLDDAFQQWKEVDQSELAVLQSRLRSFDAGERGRPANESLDELRSKLLDKYGE